MLFTDSYYRLSCYYRAIVKQCFVLRNIVMLTALLIVFPVHSESKLELDETEITGARELPKVLYIVPWKKTRPGDHPLPMHSLIDEALSPIDVDVFKRQVRYYDLTRSPVKYSEDR